MSLFSNPRKATLQDCIARLEKTRSVSARATAFHKARAEVLTVCQELSNRWRIDERQVKELEVNTGELEAVGEHLQQLFEGAESALGYARELAEQVSNLPSESLRIALEARRKAIVGGLEDLGTRMVRRSTREAENELLKQLKANLLQLKRVVDELAQVRTLLGRLKSRPEHAEFQRALQELEVEQARFASLSKDPLAPVFEEGWFVGLETARQLIEQEVNRPLPQKPADLGTARTLIDEATEWASTLGLSTLNLERLDARIQEFDNQRRPPADAVASAVRQEAQEAVDTFARQAASARREKLATLQALESLLKRAGCLTERIMLELQALEVFEVRAPGHHRKWLERHARAEGVFIALATADEPTLEGWLRATRAGVAEMVGEALTQRPGPLLKRQLLAAQTDTCALDHPGEMGALIEGLRKVDLLHSQVQQTRGALQARSASLESARDRFAAELAQFRALVEPFELGVGLPDPESLNKAWQDLDLDEREGSLARAGEALSEVVILGRREARRRLNELLSRHDETVAHLEELGAPAVSSGPSAVASGAELEELLSALAWVEQALAQVDALLEGRCRALVQIEFPSLVARLQALDADTLPVDARTTLYQLLDERSPTLRELPCGHLEQALELWDSIQRGSDLLRRAEEEVASVGAHREALIERLRRFTGTERLRSWCPPYWVHRLTGLLHGVPVPIADAAVAKAQLEEAEALLVQLEDHARRVAVHHLEEARRTLELHLARNPQIPQAGEIEKLLEQVATSDPHTHLSPRVRERIIRLNRELPHG